MPENDPNSLKKELFFVIGGLSLIFFGFFVFLPIWVAISPPLPGMDIFFTIALVLSGFIVLGWGFKRFRWSDIKAALEEYRKASNNVDRS